MTTEKPSPLRRWVGDVARPRSRATRVDDWIGLNCGDHVMTTDDERHVGRVEAIFDGVTARVRWLDNGWITDFAIADLVVVRK